MPNFDDVVEVHWGIMKELLVLLWPDYVAKTLKELSGPLIAFVEQHDIKVVEGSWGGTIESLETVTNPCLIRASSLMRCSRVQLAHFAQEHGHFVFYEALALKEDGTYSDRDEAYTLLSEWLERVHA